MSTVTASLGVLTKQGTFKYNKILLEIKNKLHEIKALKSYFSIWIHVKKNQKKRRSASSHFYHITKAIGTHVHKGSNKAACLLKSTTANWTAFNASCKNTSFFQKLVSVQNCSLFSSLLSLQKSLHSNAKTPSFEILSQYIATFFLVAWAS